MSKEIIQRYCECGNPIYKSSTSCRSCHNRTRHNKDSLLTTRRALKIGIRGIPDYVMWKDIVMARDGYKCRGCGITEKLDIHHVKKEYDIIIEEFTEKYKDLLGDKRTLLMLASTWMEFWDIDNGITVCRPCHLKFHSGQLTLKNCIPI
jgi:5-methylcytosine-specific restriction endonuclease McrA